MGKSKKAREKTRKCENTTKNEWEMRKNEPNSKSLSRACKKILSGSQEGVNRKSIHHFGFSTLALITLFGFLRIVLSEYQYFLKKT